MVYTNIVDASRTHFISISSNYNNNTNFIGTKINIKTVICETTLHASKILHDFKNYNEEVFKNRIIFSTKITDNNTNNDSITLLSQQNLFHNIKFIQKNNNFKEPRILFTKYNITNNIINSNKNLLNINNIVNSSNRKQHIININDVSMDIHNNDNEIEEISKYNHLKRLSYFFNIYKPFINSDYYKFKFTDFIDLSYINTKTNTNFSDYNNLKFFPKSISLKNNFTSNQLINYDISNFTNLFNFEHNGAINNDLVATDISILPLDFFTDNISKYHYKYDNILLYNQYDNISTINYSLKYNNVDIESYNDSSTNINFMLLKGFDYTSKDYGKIYLTPDFTYLNSRVLGYNNDFYSNNINYSSGLHENFIYLSFGNAISGITQKNLYKNMKLDINLKKIYFSNSVNSSNISDTLKNKNYLLEENYNYNYTNILYNNIQESSIKNIDLSLLEFYHNYNSDFSHNIYNHRFNSLCLLNNQINSNKFDVSYIENNNEFFITNNNDISYSNIQNKFNINNLNINQAITNNTLNYDFRFNYNSIFNVDILLTLNYNYGSAINELSYNDLNHYRDNLLLNFHKIILTSNINTIAGNDFKNVNCVFIYHDPESNNTPNNFKYPYNNIEISNNPNFDTLNKAIELLPNAISSVTNTTIIPNKNGSNLSKKMIQGLIGLNKIPSLLSIEPYDENFIIGRGFLNQYQIEDECNSEIQKIKDKLNSQKHISVKNPPINNINSNLISRKKNFSNIVRSRVQNQNLSNAKSCKTDPATIQNYTTPFINPMWKKR